MVSQGDPWECEVMGQGLQQRCEDGDWSLRLEGGTLRGRGLVSLLSSSASSSPLVKDRWSWEGPVPVATKRRPGKKMRGGERMIVREGEPGVELREGNPR